MGERKIGKIVYFDEASVADYVQIAKGGVLEETTELLKSKETNMEGNLHANGKFKIGKILKIFSGVEAEAAADVGLGASLNTNKLEKNVIKNTILTDFINILQEDEKNKVIKKFEKYTISVEKDSMAYMAMVSPYLTMLRGGTVEAGEFDIAVEEFDNAMRAGKGYYELIAEKASEIVILRFNINSFKNNYRIADLLKMDLSIYAIKVGSACRSDLNINNELELDIKPKNDNPSYTKEKLAKEIKMEERPLAVYDVLLAGVEVYD